MLKKKKKKKEYYLLLPILCLWNIPYFEQGQGKYGTYEVNLMSILLQCDESDLANHRGIQWLQVECVHHSVSKN